MGWRDGNSSDQTWICPNEFSLADSEGGGGLALMFELEAVLLQAATTCCAVESSGH